MHRAPCLAARLLLVPLGSTAGAEQACAPIRLTFENPRVEIKTEIACVVSRDPALARHLTSRARAALARDRRKAAVIRMGVASSVRTDTKATFSNDKVISLLERRDEYFGGPHGMTRFRSLAWDLMRHRSLELETFLVDARKDGPVLVSLARLTRARLAADWNEKARKTVVEDPDEYWEGSIRPDSATFRNWTLETGPDGKASGLAVHFEPYRVAGHADGAQSVFLPFKDIEALIRPEHREMFGRP